MKSLILASFLGLLVFGCVEDPDFNCSQAELEQEPFSNIGIYFNSKSQENIFVQTTRYTDPEVLQVYLNPLLCDSESCHVTEYIMYEYEYRKLIPPRNEAVGQLAASYFLCTYDDSEFVLENSEGDLEKFTFIKDSLNVININPNSPYDQVYPDTTYKDTSLAEE